ncbi:MAG: hypothetical protein RKK15_11860 [Defluviicoccus sp.]|nr:hypothetical protein [Defluviicoccus sp.]
MPILDAAADRLQGFAQFLFEGGPEGVIAACGFRRQRGQRTALSRMVTVILRQIAASQALQSLRPGFVLRLANPTFPVVEQGMLQGGGRQGRLARKVRIESAMRQPGIAHHLGDTCASKTLDAQTRPGSLQDSVSGFSFVRSACSHDLA